MFLLARPSYVRFHFLSTVPSPLKRSTQAASDDNQGDSAPRKYTERANKGSIPISPSQPLPTSSTCARFCGRSATFSHDSNQRRQVEVIKLSDMS